jgi:hypothetical protein
LAITIQRQLKQCAETAQAADDTVAPGAFDDGFYAFDQCVARIDVNAGVTVADRRAGTVGSLS